MVHLFLKKSVDSTLQSCRHHQSGVSVVSFFPLTNENFSCFCVFLFFSVFFFSSIYLWCDAGYWLGVGAWLVLWCCPPLDWTAQTLSLPTNQWLLSNGFPLLYSAEKLWFNLLTICFSQNVFGIINLPVLLEHVAVVVLFFCLHIFLPLPPQMCLLSLLSSACPSSSYFRAHN